MPGRIDILLPGLLHLPLHELDRERLAHGLPALNRLLRFASPRPNDRFGIDAALCPLLGIDTPGGACLPLAQAWAGEGAAEDARLLLCRPVHLRADLQHALLVPIPESEENLKDIAILINSLSDLFKVDCDISEIADGLYLMRLREIDAPIHYPHLLSVLGKPVNPYVEQSREHLAWYRLINEMQMFLHQHSANTRRVEAGKLPINSLWCWGGGARPSPASPAPNWYCDDLLLNRFAASLGLSPSPPGDLVGAASDGDIVAVDLRLLNALKAGAVEDLDALLQAVERELIGPALRAAEAGRRELRLWSGGAQDFCLGPKAALKFWRRPRTLAACSEAGDET